jgi:hypothetical protein
LPHPSECNLDAKIWEEKKKAVTYWDFYAFNPFSL